jgi:lysophospholipase L1-like esterase
MPRVKTIVLLVAMPVFWAIVQQTACVKHNGVVMASSPAPSPSRDRDTLAYLALGDSYTIGQSVGVDDRFPARVTRRLRADSLFYKAPEIIAVTGWTTSNLLAAMPATVPSPAYHVVSLLIGVNNQYQHLSQSEYRSQFTSLLQQSIRLAGNRPAHVIVLSIPDYSVTPFARGSNTAYIAAQIDSFNFINREISQAYQVQYLDVTGESRKAADDPSLIAVDSLHFSGKEYDIWAGMMEPLMKLLH